VWSTEILVNALRGFDSEVKKQLVNKAYGGEFSPLINRKNVWHKTIELNGRPFSIHAVETKS
jgi:hypothetical protein